MKRHRFHIFFLLATLWLSTTSLGQRSSSDRTPALIIRTVQNIDVFKELRPVVAPAVEVTGNVEALPYGAEIRLASLCDGNSVWQLLDGVAFIAANGEWRFPKASLIGSAKRGTHFCKLLALIVAPLKETSLDDESIRKAYITSRAVDLEVDTRLSPEPGRSELSVSFVAELPVTPDQAVVVPPSFTLKGGSRNIQAGTLVKVFGSCGDHEWQILETSAIAVDGHWSTPPVTLESAHSGSRCNVIAATLISKRLAERYSFDELVSATAVRSAVIQLVHRQAHLAVLVITDVGGIVHVVEREVLQQEAQVMKLSRDVSAIRITGDPLPPEYKVWIAVQDPASMGWMLFGPAQQQAPDEWIVYNVRLIMPGKAELGRTVRAIASRQFLHGRVMNAEDLQAAALGSSEVVRLSVPAADPCRGAQARLRQVDGKEFTAGDVFDVSRMLTVVGEFRHNCRGMSPWIGLATGSPAKVRFYPFAQRSGQSTAQVQTAIEDEDVSGEIGNLILALAPDIFDTTTVDAAWAKAFTAIYVEPQLSVKLPGPPWFVRVRTGLRHIVDLLGGIEMSFTADLWKLAPWILAAVIVIPVLAAFRSLPRWRVWFNARVDAAKAILRRAQHTPYQQFLLAQCQQAKAKLGFRLKPKIAALKSSIAELNRITLFCDEQMKILQALTTDHVAGISATMHHMAYVILTIGELTFNAAAFRVFREADLFTFVMSLSLGIAVPVCAYFIGVTVKRWQSRTGYQTAFVVAAACALILALWAVNEIRVAHLIKVDADFLTQNPGLHLAFIPVNAVVVLATALLVCLRNEKVERYRDLQRKQRRAKSKIARLMRREARLGAKLMSKLEAVDAYYESLLLFYLTIYERHAQYKRAASPISPTPEQPRSSLADDQMPPTRPRPNGHDTEGGSHAA